jgi:putative hydrolase of the HAD superfamily
MAPMACYAPARSKRWGESMIRAVLWDFGGVVTTSPFDNFARYEREHGLPRDFLRSINAADPDTNAWARFERGEIDHDTFDALFEAEAAARGHPVPGRAVIALLMGEARPEMVTALRLCAARLPCACITNNVAAGLGATMSHTQAHADEIVRIMSG